VRLVAVLACLPLIAHAEPRHAWCGQVPPGNGLRYEQRDGRDVWCGWIKSAFAGQHEFLPSAPGTRIVLDKQPVDGPVELSGLRYSFIYISAPATPDFNLKWRLPLGVVVDVPPTQLYRTGVTRCAES
jgi:hypothetical protein